MNRPGHEHCEAVLTSLEHERDVLKARLAEVELERDLAIAHDRQPYPTAHAYEQVCKALETSRASCEAIQRELRALATELKYGAHALYRQKAIAVCDFDWLLAQSKKAERALSLTPADVGKREEAMRQVVDAAKDSENRDYVTMELRQALADLAAQDRSGTHE